MSHPSMGYLSEKVSNLPLESFSPLYQKGNLVLSRLFKYLSSYCIVLRIGKWVNADNKVHPYWPSKGVWHIVFLANMLC